LSPPTITLLIVEEERLAWIKVPVGVGNRLISLCRNRLPVGKHIPFAPNKKARILFETKKTIYVALL
jgi:hypothetical protein